MNLVLVSELFVWIHFTNLGTILIKKLFLHYFDETSVANCAFLAISKRKFTNRKSRFFSFHLNFQNELVTLVYEAYPRKLWFW